MKVKFLNDYPKTIDGQQIGPFAKGQEAELPYATAQKFINSAMCIEVIPESQLAEIVEQVEAE